MDVSTVLEVKFKLCFIFVDTAFLLCGADICFNTLHTNYMFQWKEDILLIKIPQAISRTTGPNIDLFGFILMHFSC